MTSPADFQLRTNLAAATARCAEAFLRLGIVAAAMAADMERWLKGPCPVCKGKLVADGEPENYCADCDGNGTLEGWVKMQQAYADAYGPDDELLAWQLQTALTKIWGERCQQNDESLPGWKRWAYAFKTFWCIKANWCDPEDRDRDYVDVVTIDSEHSGYGWSATWMATPYGFGPGTWHYTVKHDSDSFY